MSSLVKWLLTEAGLRAADYRPAPLNRRLAACLRAIHAKNSDEARMLIAADSRLLTIALDALLIGVTGFYRDEMVFDRLRQTVIPELIKKKAKEQGGLRVWSAACASGAELYTVALLLAEHGVLESSRLLGTDCRSTAIAAAARGIYPACFLEQLPPFLHDRYFVAHERGVQIDVGIRGRIRWQVSDLLSGVETGPWDMILWRNSAIYMRHESANDIWRQMVGQLRPCGLLMTGKAERPPRDIGLRSMGRCLYLRSV